MRNKEFMHKLMRNPSSFKAGMLQNYFKTKLMKDINSHCIPDFFFEIKGIKFQTY